MNDAVLPTELPDDLRTALRRQVLTLADSKRLMGIRYSDWLLGAPSIETGIAASGMAQDEWGHARLLYAMLKDFDEDPGPIEKDRAAEAYASVDPLDEAQEDWAALVAAMVVVDGALTVALEGFGESGFESARTRIPKMLSEEEFHRDLALAWLRRLVAGTDEARARVVEALRACLPRTLAWLAPADEPFRALVDADLMPDGAELLRRFEARYGAALSAAGVPLNEVEPERGQWDRARGRGPGHPSEEAVQRARGDLNRALFVE